MTDKDNRICPVCGKPLKLIPPSRELLPSRTGFSTNGVVYYYPPAMRFLRITSKPQAKHKRQPGNSWHYEKTLNPNIVKNQIGDPAYHLVPVKYAQKRIDKDGSSLFSDDLIFYCNNCKEKVMINTNPVRWFMNIWHWVLIYILLFFCVFTFIVVEKSKIPSSFFVLIGLSVPAAVSLINLVGYMIFMTSVKKYESNFVPADDLDNLIYPPTDFVLGNGINPAYLREGNVFQIKTDDDVFYIYLVNKKSLEFHICGIDGEQNRLLSLIREKQERGEPVTLPLTFEGKFVGNAEVLETYSPQARGGM